MLQQISGTDAAPPVGTVMQSPKVSAPLEQDDVGAGGTDPVFPFWPEVGTVTHSPRGSGLMVQDGMATGPGVAVAPGEVGVLPGAGAVKGVPLTNVPTEGINEVKRDPSGFVSMLVTVAVEMLPPSGNGMESLD